MTPPNWQETTMMLLLCTYTCACIIIQVQVPVATTEIRLQLYVLSFQNPFCFNTGQPKPHLLVYQSLHRNRLACLMTKTVCLRQAQLHQCQQLQYLKNNLCKAYGYM